MILCLNLEAASPETQTPLCPPHFTVQIAPSANRNHAMSGYFRNDIKTCSSLNYGPSSSATENPCPLSLRYKMGQMPTDTTRYGAGVPSLLTSIARGLVDGKIKPRYSSSMGSFTPKSSDISSSPQARVPLLEKGENRARLCYRAGNEGLLLTEHSVISL